MFPSEQVSGTNLPAQTFLLWWVAVAILIEVGVWVALLLTMVTYPRAHIFAWFADLCLRFIPWS